MRQGVDDLSVHDVVTLINEYADITRDVAGEADHPYPSPRRIAAFAGDEANLVAVANELHPVFARPGQAFGILNRLADRDDLRHRFGPDGRLGWTRPARSDRLASAAAVGLIDFIDIHGAEPLGICAADNCVDVYVDASQARRRAYCSDRCNNKTRAARWRARHRSDPTRMDT
jgi:CGNR zinc finger protein